MLHLCARFVLLFLLTLSPVTAQENPSADDEPFGKLKLGQAAKVVTDLLGQPAKRGKIVKWEATGDWVQTWDYPAQGLELTVASTSRKGPQRLHSITAKTGCKLATARGIRLGSTEAEVRTAYAKFEEKEQSRPGETFVAGSVYGGIIFTFAAGRVSQIFIGAAAE